MFFIGPLLFWACGEMTCGFFILCVPCLASVIKESGLPGWLSKIVDLTSRSKNTSNIDSYDRANPLPSSQKISKAGMKSTDSYYKMDEEDGGLPLGELKTSESQENLRTQQGKNGVHVARTTHVIVTSDSQSAQSGSDLEDKATPWTR